MSFSDLIAKRAAAAGNPAAAVGLQNTAATATSKDAKPSVEVAGESLSGNEILAGIEGGYSSPDTPQPTVEVYEPDAEKLAECDRCFQIQKHMPFMVASDGRKINPVGQFYYLSEDVAADVDVKTFLARGNISEITK